MWVAMRSRNQRSWLMMTAQPAKSSNASSSARSVSTSRSFVGSPSSSKLEPGLGIFAIGAGIYLALAEQDDVLPAGDFLPHVLLAVERVARLVDIAEMHGLADLDG